VPVLVLLVHRSGNVHSKHLGQRCGLRLASGGDRLGTTGHGRRARAAARPILRCRSCGAHSMEGLTSPRSSVASAPTASSYATEQECASSANIDDEQSIATASLYRA
jgi:hypothetical protein